MVQILTPPDPAAELVRLVGLVQAQLPEWRAETSSPIRYALELRVQDRVQEVALLNASGEALIVSTAEGQDLDQLLQNFGMVRQPFEQDEAFRARVPQHFAGLSRETVPGLIGRVVQQDEVADAAMVRGANYAVTVYIQEDGFTASTAGIRTAIQNYLNGPDVRPWYADFTVAAETRTAYTVAGIVTLAPTGVESVVSPLVDSAIDSALLLQRRLNRVPALSPVIAAVQAVDGVDSVVLTATPNSVLSASASPSVVFVGARGSVQYV